MKNEYFIGGAILIILAILASTGKIKWNQTTD